MTDFKIPYEAVEAACVAYNVKAGLGYSIAGHYCMRAALEAALPVLLVRVGWARPISHDSTDVTLGKNEILQCKEYPMGFDWTPLYTIKEPK